MATVPYLCPAFAEDGARDEKLSDKKLKKADAKAAKMKREEERKEKYRNYLENIVPSTDKLIESVKSHIEGKMSVNAVSSYLEPFSIESNEITKSRYNHVGKQNQNKTAKRYIDCTSFFE